MNKDEDRILHGLYSFRGLIDERIPVTGAELEWLAHHTLREGREWHRDGKFQTLDRSQGPQDTRFTAFTAQQTRPLRYLAECGLIIINKAPGSIQIFEVTKAGAERARRLQTWYGRVDLWYRDRKEGVVGLWIPTVAAITTSILTNWVIHILIATPQAH